jgi:TolA-binding protein
MVITRSLLLFVKAHLSPIACSLLVAVMILPVFISCPCYADKKADEVVEAALDAAENESRQKAIPLLERAEKTYPFHNANIEVLFQLGMAYLDVGDYDAARKAFDIFLKRYGKYADTLIRVDEAVVARAKVMGAQEKYDDAIRELNKFLKDRRESKARDYAYIELANIHIKQGNLAEARKLLTPIAKDRRSSMNDQAMFLMAELTIKEGSVGQTEALMQNLLRSARTKATKNQALFKLGDIYRNSSNFVKAIDSYRRIKASGNDRDARELNSGILFEISTTYERLGHPLEARVGFEGIAEKFPELAISTVAWHRSIMNYADYGDYDRGEEKYLAYIKKHPGIPIASDLRLYFAQQLMQKEKFEEAIGHLQAGVQEYPTGQWAETSYHTLGIALLGAKRYKEAEKALNDFAKNFPESPLVPESYAFLAEGFIEQNQYQSAIDVLQSVIEKFPDAPAATSSVQRIQETYLMYGDFLATSNRTDEAVAQYRKVTDPVLVEQAMILEGDAYLQGDRYEEAIQTYEKFIETYPQSTILPQAYLTMANAHMQTEEYKKAEETLQMIETLSISPTNPVLPVAKLQAAFCRYYLDDPTGMSNTLSSLVETYPESSEAGEALYWIGYLHRSRGVYAVAADVYGKLAARYPEHDYAHEAAYTVGECYAMLNDIARAGDSFIDAFKRFPASGYGVYALTRGGALYAQIEQSEAWLQKLDELEKDLPVYGPAIQVARAGTLMRAGKADEAADALSKVKRTALPPEVAGFAYALDAGITNLKKQHGTAESLARKAVDICAETGVGLDEALYQLGRSQFLQKNWEGAAEVYTELTENVTMPDLMMNAIALIDLGECLVNLGRTDEVIAVCDKGIRFRPGPELTARAVLLKGDAMRKRNDYQKAAQYYKRAAILYDGFKEYAVPAYKGLIEAYQQLGMADEAADAQKQLKERYPDA